MTEIANKLLIQTIATIKTSIENNHQGTMFYEFISNCGRYTQTTVKPKEPNGNFGFSFWFQFLVSVFGFNGLYLREDRILFLHSDLKEFCLQKRATIIVLNRA